MKKIIFVLFASLFIVGCTNNVEPEVEEKTEEKVEDKEEIKEEVKEEVKEEPKEEVVAPVEEVQENPTAGLEQELADLIAAKEALIFEKQNVGQTMRGQAKGQRMREINQEIGAIGQRIGEIKGQLGID